MWAEDQGDVGVRPWKICRGRLHPEVKGLLRVARPMDMTLVAGLEFVVCLCCSPFYFFSLSHTHAAL